METKAAQRGGPVGASAPHPACDFPVLYHLLGVRPRGVLSTCLPPAAHPARAWPEAGVWDCFMITNPSAHQGKVGRRHLRSGVSPC